jgi:hypothetical protein
MAAFQLTTDASLVVRSATQWDADTQFTIGQDYAVGSDVRVLVCGKRRLDGDLQQIIRNEIEVPIDLQLAIAWALHQSSSAAVRVTHSRQHSLDTALRISGSRGLVSDSAQRLLHSIDRTAEAELTIFNVIINEQHEIQSHGVAS